MAIIDLHNLNIEQVKERIRKAVEDLIINPNKMEMRLIHGHNRGTVIRDYIRSGELETFLKNIGYAKKLILCSTKEDGSTIIRIKTPPITEFLVSRFSWVTG